MNKIIKTFFILSVAILAIFFTYVFYFADSGSVQNSNAPKTVPEANSPVHNENTAPYGSETVTVVPPKIETKGVFALPLSSALERVTEKPFGIKVSPKSSLVSPERFSGYHAGVDFEIFPGEENSDVSVSAVCPGPLLEKRIVSGYGGVSIQKCSIENAAVTVLYGHLKLSSVERLAGDELSAGEKIGVLGKGYSAQTSGERKHLHFGIHRGSKISYLGYVQSESKLLDWIDAMKYLK